MSREFDPLRVPTFARLTDYCGLWSIEPSAAAMVREQAAGLDLDAHISAATRPQSAGMQTAAGNGGKSIAVITLGGLLMKSQSSMGGTSTIEARRQIRSAVADPNVGGILLAIDSPGGTVSGTDDIARDVAAAAAIKPVWAAIEDLGASAAFWIASQASRITANSATALVGSIGTYQTIYDQSGAAEKAGIKTLLFSTGPLKGLGTPGTQVSDVQIAHVQKLIDDVQKSFDAAVMAGRRLTVEQLAAVRHGGAMTATSALNAKLIDAIQPLGRTLSELQSTGGARAGLLPMLSKPTLTIPRVFREIPRIQQGMKP